MPDVLEFDLRSRGAVSLADESAVKAIWRLEDIVSKFNEVFSVGFDLFEQYCERGSFPITDYKFCHFADRLRALLHSSAHLMEAAALCKQDGYEVQGARTLASHIRRGVVILNEDDFATEMAFLNIDSEAGE